jgi:hypothetical protein
MELVAVTVVSRGFVTLAAAVMPTVPVNAAVAFWVAAPIAADAVMVAVVLIEAVTGLVAWPATVSVAVSVTAASTGLVAAAAVVMVAVSVTLA